MVAFPLIPFKSSKRCLHTFVRIIFQMYSGIIRDVGFLHESWPWCSGHKSLVSVASDGLCKVIAYYRPRTKYDRRLCFHKCLSVNRSSTPSSPSPWPGRVPLPPSPPPPPQPGRGRLCGASVMTLAFTQEDFLVCILLLESETGKGAMDGPCPCLRPV